MEMFRFANIELLWGLLIIPLLALIFAWSRIARKRALKRFGKQETISVLMPFTSKSRPVFKFIMLMLALAFFIVGAARPQFGSKLKKVKREGVELMIALDVSNSMMAEDIEPNRLERAKRAISRLVDRLSDDKIGLIVFAGDAYMQLPITSDYNSAKLFLNSVNTQIVPTQGTAIGTAIQMGIRSFTPEGQSNKAIIVITDGENHEDDPVSAAQEAVGNGIVVHTIGMGLPSGSPIPVLKGGQKDYMKDKNGEVVITKLNETMLEKIASTGNGIYVRANNAQVGLNALFDEINKLEKEEMETLVYSEYDDQFQYFFAIGLLLLLLEFVTLERKNKYLMKVNLFSTK
ncbi:Ca-activated chloride channel family protein [Tangfeifania diversioriginum]|uniref:Ca-activated chloride channel family protein n=1 Tax=Tangfeifania diversioriginum TaxID=1168035 RepID=A0A1M6HZ37_9BACT|nr:VWA domain-containing protein [Tangfeifania diversioriginum]SHJ27395.1 Ca-activated chloride channel family protein [Tangfeifania diversioriginum]